MEGGKEIHIRLNAERGRKTEKEREREISACSLNTYDTHVASNEVMEQKPFSIFKPKQNKSNLLSIICLPN